MRASALAHFKRMDPRRGARATALSALSLGFLSPLPSGLVPQEPPPAAVLPARPATVAATMDQLEAAYRDRDVERALALYAFPDEESRQAERETLLGLFATEAVELVLQRPARVPAETNRVLTGGQIFSTTEPRARIDECRFTLERD